LSSLEDRQIIIVIIIITTIIVALVIKFATLYTIRHPLGSTENNKVNNNHSHINNNTL